MPGNLKYTPERPIPLSLPAGKGEVLLEGGCTPSSSAPASTARLFS